MKYRIKRTRKRFRWKNIWICTLIFTVLLYTISIMTHVHRIPRSEITAKTESQQLVKSVMLYPIERSKVRHFTTIHNLIGNDLKTLAKVDWKKGRLKTRSYLQKEKQLESKNIVKKFSSRIFRYYNKTKHHFTPLQVSDDAASNAIADLYPNMPIRYWLDNDHLYNLSINQSPCATFPNIYKLNIQNKYWQVIHLTNATTVQVYSAFYDNREMSVKIVRILAMINKTTSNFPGNRTIHCQFWFNNNIRPVVAQMDNFDLTWPTFWNIHKDGMFGPFLLGCTIPQSHIHDVPRAVSIVENECDNATNMLRVVYNKPVSKKEFAVCVKGLDLLQIDLSFRLVEWIELMFLMGVDKIFFYHFEVHPNIKAVLEYYINLGKIDVRDITLPEGETSIPFLRHKYFLDNNLLQCLNEVIPYNDCFYRNLYSYEYVALLDIDEIILPLKDDNWHDLIERAKSNDKPDVKYNSFMAQHIYFLDRLDNETPYEDIPPYMHMMQHVYRSENFTSWHSYVKTIFSTNYTVACFNHFPILVFVGSEGNHMTYEDARVQHYREDCPKEIRCQDYEKYSVKDTRLWRYKDILIPKVEQVVDKLKLLDSYETN